MANSTSPVLFSNLEPSSSAKEKAPKRRKEKDKITILRQEICFRAVTANYVTTFLQSTMTRSSV